MEFSPTRPALAQAAQVAPSRALSSRRLEPLRHVDAGVLDIAYYEEGPADGPVVVLLHGFPYDIHSYVDVAPLLAAKGCRAIVPYLRGYGPTRFLDKATPRSGEQAAIGADLIALMDALGIERAVFAGYDWGGRAACVAAALWPDRCAGLVSREQLSDPGHRKSDGAVEAGARGRALVSVLFSARARTGRPCRQSARDRQDIMAAMVAELALRRGDLRANGAGPRQSRLRRYRDPQLPPSLRSCRGRPRNMPICSVAWRRCPRSRSRPSRLTATRTASPRPPTAPRPRRSSPAAAPIASSRARVTIFRRKSRKRSRPR